MSIATTPLQYESQELDRLYQPTSIISPTESAISKHFSLLTRGAVMAHAAAVEIDKLCSPMTQNIMDMYHQSWLPWNEFKTSSDALNNLGTQTSSILDSYQTNFTRSIYAPLSSLFSRPQKPQLLKGDPNLLLQQLSAVYNHLKTRNVAPNCCLQICVRSQNYSQNGDFDNNKSRFAAKETTFTDFDDIARVMRENITTFDLSGYYCYKRYEILSDKEQFQIFEAKCNNTIPDCSSQHPLCKIYNTIQGILPGELAATDPGLVTVAFLKQNNCIRVELIYSDGAQLYGQRIFKQDLINTVPKLFENCQLSERTQSQLDTLQFLEDGTYNEYHKQLNNFGKPWANEISDKTSNGARISLADRLPGFVDDAANAHHKPYDLNLLELTRCFNDNNIDAEYIRTHTVKEFRYLLGISCGITAGVATGLWRYLGGFGRDNPKFGIYTYYDEKEESEDDEEVAEDDDEAEYDPTEDVEFYEGLLEMYNDYEEEEIQQISQEFREMLLRKESISIQDDDDDYDADELSPPPWDEDEDEEANGDDEEEEEAPPSCKDEDPPSEQAHNYVDDSLSLQSDWSDDEEDEYPQQQPVYDRDLELGHGESLLTQSDWEDEVDNVDFNASGPSSYYYLERGTVENINLNAMVNFLLSYNELFNYFVIRYLYFCKQFLTANSYTKTVKLL